MATNSEKKYGSCGTCQFLQHIGTKMICRNKKVAIPRAKKGLVELSDDEMRQLCPHYFKKRQLPENSPIRGLISPGYQRLKEIAENHKLNQSQQKESVKERQKPLDL